MSSRANLAEWGWDARHEAAFAARAAADLEPGRVLVEERASYLVRVSGGEARGSLSGRFRFDAELAGGAAVPAVGDWVALQPTGDPDHRLVRDILPRRTAVVRRAPADRGTADQVLAANVDLLLVVTSLNRDFNARRLERYLALAWGSGAQPVVVLSKADLVDDPQREVARVLPLAGAAPVHALSAATGAGLAALTERLEKGRTVALVGSSGVGKSTLLNALAGRSIEATRAIRQGDDRGRHATTRRHLVLVPGRGLLLDTPGMRELGLSDSASDGIDAAFGDLDALANDCRFADCRHDREPGCAVRAAIAEGRLDAARLAGRRKLDRELARAERERDLRVRAADRRKWRLIHAAVNQRMRTKYGEDRS